MNFLKRNSKAIIAALGALVTGYVAVRDGGISQEEVIGLVVATLAAGGITFGAPFNKGVGSVDGPGA